MHLSGSADLLQRSWGRPPGLPSRAAGPAAHRLPPRPRVSARRSPTNVSAPSAPSGFDFESPLPSRSADSLTLSLHFPPRPRVSAVRRLDKPMESIGSPGRMPSAARRSPTNVSAPSVSSGFDFQRPSPSGSIYSPSRSLRLPPRLRVSAVMWLYKPMGSISSPGRMPSAARRSPTNVAAPSMSSGVDFQRPSPSRSTYSPSLPPRLRVSAVKRQPQTTENPQW